MPRVTPDEIRRMPASQVIDLLEGKLQVRLPLEMHLRIAMLLGAGDQGIRVIDPTPGGAPGYTEKLDLQRLADLLNTGTVSPSE